MLPLPQHRFGDLFRFIGFVSVDGFQGWKIIILGDFNAKNPDSVDVPTEPLGHISQ